MIMNYSFLSNFKQYTNSSVILIFFTISALVIANLPGINEWYFSFWQQPVSLSIGHFNFFSHNGHPISLGQMINDFLMAIFFLSVGLEIKREIKVGELSSKEKALLPIIGACGGIIIPVIIFYLVCPDDAIIQRGLAIPMATDIAFSLGILAAFKTRVPIGLKIFLAALAIADDLGGIIIIALFYSTGINISSLVISFVLAIIMVIGNIKNIRTNVFYITMGLMLWFFMLNSGIHATIAGVIIAFCIPATLKKGTGYYLERIRNNINQFPVIEVSKQQNTIILTNNQVHLLKSIESAADKMISPLQALEDKLHTLVNYLIIPLFAFANAGVNLSHMNIESVFSGVSLAVMLGLFIGKFIGVFSFSWIAVRLNIVTLPAEISWKAFASVCVLCGIGFTVSMFIADLSYADVDVIGKTLLDQAKLGVLLGSVLSAILGYVLLNKNLPNKQQ